MHPHRDGHFRIVYYSRIAKTNQEYQILLYFIPTMRCTGEVRPTKEGRLLKNQGGPHNTLSLTCLEPVYKYIILWNHALSCKFHGTLQLHNSPVNCARAIWTLRRLSKSSSLQRKGTF